MAGNNKKWLNEYAENVMNEYQVGFRIDGSVINETLILNEIHLLWT